MGDSSTIPIINDLMKQLSHDDGESPLISENFALELGNLSSDSLNQMSNSLQVAIGISSKFLQNLGSNISWEKVLESTMNNPSLKCLDVKDIYHHADHKVSIGNWFQRNWHPNKSGVCKLQEWIHGFVPSTGLFDNHRVSERFCERVVQRTLTELKKCPESETSSSLFAWSTNLLNWEKDETGSASDQENDDDGNPDATGVIHAVQAVAAAKPKKIYKESPLIDIVVFRFPDIKQGQFVIYHLKLNSWVSITEANPVTKERQKVKVGTWGEYHKRRFDVREEFVHEIKEETRQKAIQEATNFLSKYDDCTVPSPGKNSTAEQNKKRLTINSKKDIGY